MRSEHGLQESYPALADSGLAIGHACEVWPEPIRQHAKYRFGIG
jgi:hypothetical protein